MADSTRLRKIRGTVKAKLTRFKTKIWQLRDAEVDRETTEVFMSTLEDIRSEFEQVQRDIANCDQTEAGAAAFTDESEAEEFEDKYLELKIKLRRWLNKLPVPNVDTRSSTSDDTLARVLQQQSEFLQQLSGRQDSQNGGSQASSTNSDAITRLVEQQTALLQRFTDGGGAANQESKVKLPIVKLPTFNGKTEEWKRFSETYTSLIHSNTSIPNIQKFQYLATSLLGSAAKIIEAIELTDQNYGIAWGLLKKRFDDPRAIKKKHIQCLFSMPKVEKESATEIRGLIDYTLKHLRVLKSLNSPTDTWDELVMHIIESKLDIVTVRAWEQEGNADDAKLDTLTDFLQARCQMLERIEARSKVPDAKKKIEPDKQKSKTRGQQKAAEDERDTTLAILTENRKCYLCQGEHFLYHCEKFLTMGIEDRIKEVRRLKLCINCLRHDHFVKACKMGSCRECSARHNTLCHRPTSEKEQQNDENTESTIDNANERTSNNVVVHHATNKPSKRHVLMATAVVNAVRPDGTTIPLRILLDSASEAHFITLSACKRLGVKRNIATEVVSGLSGIENTITEGCEVVMQSKHSGFGAAVRSFVVPKITKMLPSIEIDCNSLKIPSNIKLADPEFYKRSAIDMLIGAEFFFDLLQSERIELGKDRPVLQNTKLGWVVSGALGGAALASLLCIRDALTTLNCTLEHCETLNQNLKKFWELESCQANGSQLLSSEARESETFFEKTTTRDENGRFVVRLPFLEDPKTLGESRVSAGKRLAQLERRFTSNKKLHDRYVDFMRDYLETGHMSLVTDQTQNAERPINYLPHHGVIKESSTSTKLRAVFDASSKTSSGKSLNDILRVGPTIQSSLLEVVTRFRFYNVALTGDIKQMYRQVLVHPEDRDCQRILWRFSRNEPVQDFRLNTVTYGEASSAYLAIRCIRKLGEEAITTFPSASRVILERLYVDDILAGAEDVEAAAALQGQLTTVLKTGGFNAHKWCSNRADTLKEVPSNLREDVNNLDIDANDIIKTLGLGWSPKDDQFQFCVRGTEAAKTKREILSAISKFFDPLGLIGPVITAAKLIMQETWRTECNWDEELPASFVERWENFRQDLNAVDTLFIPRRVIPCQHPTKTYLQGFCDASEVAYGACLYIQARDDCGRFTSRLLCSKSRVSPIKPTTIPRLELCSAVLLVHLVTNVRRSLRVRIDGIQAWSDSQVALWWIRGDTSRWKPFVANRANEIIEMLPAKYWNHVKGVENPADLISRGATLQQLRKSELWWSGPLWLRERPPSSTYNAEEFELPNEIAETIEMEERKKSQVCALAVDDDSVLKRIIAKFSTLTKIERVLAYCLRYLSNLKKSRKERESAGLSAAELQQAHLQLVQHVQGTEFYEDIVELKNNRSLKSTSKILPLHPFLDDRGILRVGGRLQHSGWNFDRKHPIILPAKGWFSRLLFEREHRRLLHAGQQLLLSAIRERYWVLRGRDLVRQVCRECMCCAENNPRELSQLMGPLPSDRVQPSPPFAVTGVDFAGPIITLVNKGRGRKTNKSYVALFVCFSTKAVHLEATSELSSAAFLATLRRFIGRRGRPRKLYSDNATNFVGADHELQEIHRFARTQIEGSIGDLLSNDRIEWRFIPPRSPHMGGLWEAGLATTLIQIEACLNSRPLTPLSTDPSDFQPLTPAHFLVGGPLTSLPDPDVTDIQLNRLNRWQLIQRVLQDFWKRWAAEYLASLQGRTKWKSEKQNLRIDDLVVLRDENLPPLKWKLGRVIALHPGHDDQVRVVTVRTENGNFKRAIVKLCKLPTSDDDGEISCANLVGGMSADL